MLRIQCLSVLRTTALLIFISRKAYYSNLVIQKENVEQKKDNTKSIAVDNVT